MSLSDLASIGSFVSGIAVLASFIFLALQLRQGNVQLRQGNINQQALIQMARTANIVDVVYRRLDPDLLAVLTRGNEGDTSMPPDEIEAYLQMGYAAFVSFENTYLQAHAGTIHPDAWDTAIPRLKHRLAAPGYRVAWKTWRHSFGGDFAEAVDRIASQARSLPWQEPGANWAADVADEMRLSAH